MKNLKEQIEKVLADPDGADAEERSWFEKLAMVADEGDTKREVAAAMKERYGVAMLDAMSLIDEVRFRAKDSK